MGCHGRLFQKVLKPLPKILILFIALCHYYCYYYYYNYYYYFFYYYY